MLNKRDELFVFLCALATVICFWLAIHNFHLLERRVFWAEKLAHSTWAEVQELQGRVEALEMVASDE